ncbi:MAG: DUF4013 domain-containing protein [Gemmataceae bacterium]
MRYWQSYRFVFKNPNWLTNLALGAVCSIIPIVGPIVFIGYCFEVIDVLLRRRQRQRSGALQAPDDPLGEWVMDALPVEEDHDSGSYPDFNFNRFSEYLMRGIWPFLAQLIVGLVVGMIAVIFLIVGLMLAGFAAAAADSPVMFLVAYGLVLVLYTFLMMLAGILTMPLYLRAGLSGDFASAFSMAFYRDFMKRVGKEVVLAELFHTATSTLLSIVGLLLCYVGIFPVIALVLYAHHHLEYQLYELYLERGGESVERKDKSPSDSEDYPDEETSSHVMRPRPEERSTDIRREDEER